MARNRPWIETEDLQLRALYDAQIPIAEIATRLGRSDEAITKRARLLGRWKRHRNADISVRFFEDISTAEQAYFLGLLASDGNVHLSKSRYSICLALKRSDVDLVVRFRDAIAPNAQLSYDRHLVRLRIGCKPMVADLAAYNIVPRKSYTFNWPDKLPNDLAMPFLLGYFDGDGCLSLHASGRLQWSLLGCEDFLWKAREHIAHWSGIITSFPAQSDQRIKHLYRIDAMSDKARMLDMALNTCGLGLPRKHLPDVLKRGSS
jgi:intein/homing endonuclease